MNFGIGRLTINIGAGLPLFHRMFLITVLGLVVTALDLTNDWGPWRRWWLDFVFGNNLYSYVEVIYFIRDAIPVVLITELTSRFLLGDSPFWMIVFLVFRKGRYAKHYKINFNAPE